MKQVTRWEAKDGRLFNTEREAEIHEVCLAFEDYFKSDEMKDVEPIFDSLKASEMRLWLELNREAVLRLLLAHDAKVKAAGNRYEIKTVDCIDGMVLINAGDKA